jgi:hypothetical protein
MGLLLSLSSVYLPGSIRSKKLDQLFTATADAFQVPPLPLKGYSHDECLEKYARFTAGNAAEVIKRGEVQQVKERLHCNAGRIGRDLRRELGVVTMEELMQACRVIYKALKIEFQGDSCGQVQIRSCFFSSFYSPEVCSLISSLDEGLLSGLSGGLKLEFSRRITEGNACCTAQLQAEEGLL